MRKIFLFMLVSVDGYFEGPDHDISWHNVDKEFNEFANNQLEEIGTLLFGRRTYDLMASFWPKSKSTTAGLMNALPKVVVSHSIFEPEWENTTIISTNVIDEICGDYGSIDRKSTRLNSSHQIISYAVFCLKKKNTT